jgi:uncharacterized protein (TIGR03000 family)
MRTSVFCALIAILAAGFLAENASAGRWPPGITCPHYTCVPASPSATVIVRLPADAKLFFDDSPTTSTGPTRFYTTPPLNPCKEFTYSVRAEATRGGQTVTQTRLVAVRAFSVSELDFGEMTNSGTASLSDPDVKDTAFASKMEDPPSVDSVYEKLKEAGIPDK